MRDKGTLATITGTPVEAMVRIDTSSPMSFLVRPGFSRVSVPKLRPSRVRLKERAAGAGWVATVLFSVVARDCGTGRRTLSSKTIRR
jgi:hypothetical protein